MANFKDVISTGPSSPVREANSIQDLVDLVESRISVNDQHLFDEQEAVVAGGLLGPFGAMIGGLLAGSSSIESPKITSALQSQRDALSGLQSAIESGDLAAMGKSLDGLWGASVPPDIEKKAREITLEAANAIAEKNYAETGILGDGALGDNILGDGYAYDYTIDLSDRHNQWSDDTVTNEYGEVSGRPVPRPDDLDTTGNGSNGKPVIIDLEGNGVEITVDGNVSFDIDGDGFLERTNWVSPDDGFLVIDLDENGNIGAGDGVITQSKEIAFSLWGNEGDTDLQALRKKFDDGNAIINPQDTVWSELRIWQDINQDGKTDDGELRTLDHWGITQINLNYDGSSPQTASEISEMYSDTSNDIAIFGNTLLGQSSYTMSGEIVRGGVGDVSLEYDSLGWKRVETENGFSFQMENGEVRHFSILDETDSKNINLSSEALDGASGDSRSNHLDASDHSRPVIIVGGSGNDSVWGGNGNDMLTGDAGADNIQGNSGNDQLFVDYADLTNGHVSGGEGFDTLIVTSDTGVDISLLDLLVESAYGGRGNDNISGAGLADDLPIFGGDGNDSLTGGSGNDRLFGEDGEDSLRGDNGDDYLSGGAGNDTLNGNASDDFLTGGGDEDLLNGGSGDDYLVGGSGSDTLYGNNHDDILHGGEGADHLNGGNGDDILRGGDGNDHLYFWRGDDLLVGGAGDDTFYLQTDPQYGNAAHWGWAVVQGGTGEDTLELNVNSVDQIRHIGGNQWQLINYNTSSDKIVIDLQDIERVVFADGRVRTLSTDTSLDTGDDYQRSNYDSWMGDGSLATQGDGQHLLVGTNTYLETPTLDGWAGNDTLSGNNNQSTIYGGQGNDQLTGDGGNDNLQGDFGVDQILGGDGNDRIYGGAGADAVAGGNGQDTIEGHEGADQIWGDDGDDLLDGGSGRDMLNGGTGHDLITGADGYDHLYGGDGNDTLNGGTGADRLYGNAGTDLINGETGADQLAGGDGNDTLNGGDGYDALLGEGGNDSLEGGDDDDWLFGGDGSDTLKGDGGNDLLRGGAGSDVINGGGELDTVSYETSSAAVTVSLAMGNASGGDAQGDTITNVENIVGSDHADSLTGDSHDNSLQGGAGNDTLSGEEGHDNIGGGDGNDSIRAGSGHDRVWGGLGQDTAYLGDGDDQFFAADQSDTPLGDTVYGENGNDEISGGAANDQLFGGNGADTVEGGGGADELNGGAHNDSLFGGDGNDTLNGGTGADRMEGGNGNDVYIVDNAADTVADNGGGVDRIETSVTFDLNTRGAGVEQLVLTGSGSISGHGNGLSNMITGTAQGNLLEGRSGNDTLNGAGGNDHLNGGRGADRLDGGGGIDRAYYSDATSGVIADLQSSSENTGEAAGDIYISIERLSGSRYGDTLSGNSLENALWGGDGSDVLSGRRGDDTLYGGNGDDRLYGGAGGDKLDGGSGNDTVLYSLAETGVTANLSNSSVNTGEAAGDTYVNIEGLWGSGHADILSGTAGANALWGVNGDDLIRGLSGNDSLYGGSGNDTLFGGAGSDRLDGGTGVDRVSYADESSALRVYLANSSTNSGSAAGDVLVSIEGVTGTNYADYIKGNSSSNTLSGGNGNDSINGDGGNDTIYGGNHRDLLVGGSGNDQLFGGFGHDTLRGGSGADILKGGNGDDSLRGESGNDQLTGDAGSDTFVFGKNFDRDQINDFQNNIDTIELRGFGLSSVSDAMSHAYQSGSRVVFDFGSGDKLVVLDTNLSALQDDIIFVG
ncbi:calcium-binding protein [Phaeobacter inhibens]|uniref:calcium-binding protein n=1 Tax=Phaeobacter inhibens TaxID=221822 RepID=UPI002490AAF6|nr:calcium-binding protein [Phaeobacter inhibens]